MKEFMIANVNHEVEKHEQREQNWWGKRNCWNCLWKLGWMMVMLVETCIIWSQLMNEDTKDIYGFKILQ